MRMRALLRFDPLRSFQSVGLLTYLRVKSAVLPLGNTINAKSRPESVLLKLPAQRHNKYRGNIT